MTNPVVAIRLQKYLATAGVASRRKCEQLMLAGEVEVDGEVVSQLGARVDPSNSVIRVSGRRIPPPSDRVYFALHKPTGVISAMSDPNGKPCLDSFVADIPQRLFHVGRLDGDTDGLILLTNDGELAQKLAHPSYEIDKTYVAKVAGELTKKTLTQLAAGVELEDGPVRPTAVKLISAHLGKSIVQLSIHEGRNRIVRRLLAEVGHPVLALSRIQFGPVRLGALPTGALRPLNSTELGALLDCLTDLGNQSRLG